MCVQCGVDLANWQNNHELKATEQTMVKVFIALKEAGLTDEQAIDSINQMQNAGIIFRELDQTPVT